MGPWTPWWWCIRVGGHWEIDRAAYIALLLLDTCVCFDLVGRSLKIIDCDTGARRWKMAKTMRNPAEHSGPPVPPTLGRQGAVWSPFLTSLHFEALSILETMSLLNIYILEGGLRPTGFSQAFKSRITPSKSLLSQAMHRIEKLVEPTIGFL
ncbi:hypothetical protein GGR57DRAFT_290891 [Xylariaceae sp. FL1272]|nr:hypothetical protein GGR57DRAFT_290891 [Xylariaceae sp. FL1272]